MASTNTLQRSINVASQFLRLAPLTGIGGFANEPAFSIGDYVRQFILGPPFAWRWNRAKTAFLAVEGVQDYTVSVWSAAKKFPLGTIVVDTNGNQQHTANTGTSGSMQPSWSPLPNTVTNDNTLQWVCDGPVGTTSALANFGWLEKGAIVDQNGVTFEIPVQLNLSEEGQANQPNSISTQFDDGIGDITFRLTPPPSGPYTVKLTFQIAAPTFASLSDTWFPIPDFFYYLYEQGVLAKSYEYFGDERFAIATQLFLRQVIAASEGLTDSQKNIFLAERIDTERESQSALGNSQHGRDGRGLYGQ